MTLLVLDQVKVSTTVLPSWTTGQPGYSQPVQGSGGFGNLSWAIASGSLPQGLTLASATGLIAGTPTTAGSSTFTVQASDTSVPPLTVQKQLTIVIKPQVFILSQSVPDGVKGSGYSTSLAATGGTLPYTWTVSSGLSNLINLGLLLDPTTGVLSGLPIASTLAPVAFTVTVTDAAGSSVNLPNTINVVDCFVAGLPSESVAVAFIV